MGNKKSRHSRDTINALGNFEAEISHEGEAGLVDCYNNCKKNPGHKKFIPIKDFNMNHLPARYRCQDMEDLVKALADITVRISNTYISHERPEFFYDQGIHYPFHDCRGRHRLLAGTGLIFDIEKYSEKDNYLCPCNECCQSQTDRVVWGLVKIKTVPHVVFDDWEASRTTCHIVDADLQSDCVVALTDLRMFRKDVGKDYCEVYTVTHDWDMLTRLEERVRQFYKLQVKVRDKYDSANFRRHPLTEHLTQKLHTTVIFGRSSSKLVSVDSTFGQDPLHLDYRNKEDEPENNLNEKVWVDVEELNIKDLPEAYRDRCVLDFIRVQAELTVKLSVSQVSSDRPGNLRRDSVGGELHGSGRLENFRQRTNMSLLGIGGQESMRPEDHEKIISGSGYVIHVYTFISNHDTVCECETCLVSAEPKKVWGHVLVTTSPDVVYDKYEANGCTCYAYFDKPTLQFSFSNLTMVTQYPDLEPRRRTLIYATHDMVFLSKLEYLSKRRSELAKKVQHKMIGFESTIPNVQDPQLRDNNLAVIVSHPHGQGKHVTVGEWTGRKIDHCRSDGSVSTLCTYTAPSCPGSSGAPVFMFDSGVEFCHHPHSRGQRGNMNESSVWWDMY